MTDWRELLKRDDIDLIDINAPSNAHKEIALAAAKAGLSFPCLVFTGLGCGSALSFGLEIR